MPNRKITKNQTLVFLVILSSFMVGLSQMTDEFPVAARPYILAGSLLVGSVAAGLRVPRGSLSPGRRRFKREGALALTLTFAVLTMACDPNVPGTGRIIETSAIEAQKEFRAMQKAGEIESATADEIIAALYEFESQGHSLSLNINYNALTKQGKRELLKHNLELFSASLGRLNDAGVLGLKSAKAQRRFNEVKRSIDRGISTLNVVLASLPVPETTPTPSPSPLAEVTPAARLEFINE